MNFAASHSAQALALLLSLIIPLHARASDQSSMDASVSAVPDCRKSLLRGQPGSGVVSHRHAQGAHPDQQRSGIFTAADPHQRGEAGVSFFSDVRILLISHAHFDHCGGSEQIIRETGAKYFVMDADVPVVESGGKADFAYGDDKSMRYPPAHVDRVLHDGDTVSLGGMVLTAHLTPATPRAQPPGRSTSRRAAACCTWSLWAAPM